MVWCGLVLNTVRTCSVNVRYVFLLLIHMAKARRGLSFSFLKSKKWTSVPLCPSRCIQKAPDCEGCRPAKNRRGGILNYPLPSEKRGAAEKEGRGSFKAQGLPPSCYSCFFGGEGGTVSWNHLKICRYYSWFSAIVNENTPLAHELWQISISSIFSCMPKNNPCMKYTHERRCRGEKDNKFKFPSFPFLSLRQNIPALH